MAGLAKKMTTREGLEVIERTGPDGKARIESFVVRLQATLVDASVVQLRVVSEEGREMLLDRLYAARAQVPGQPTVPRPARTRRPDIPAAERRPFRHKPLAAETVARKVEAGQDGRKLIASGEYTYGIEVFKGTRKGETYYTVRPKPGMHPDAGVTHRVLAAFLEFGTSRMPKRPHWAPVLRAVRDILKKKRKSIQAEALRKALRKAK